MIALACFAVYANALSNGFVYDDEAQVVNNPWIRDPAAIKEMFTSGVWGFYGSVSNYYRPFMHLVYLAVYQAFGLSSAAFHASNLLLHAFASVTVFLLVQRLMEDGRGENRQAAYASFVAGLLYAVHPIHTEAVTWVAGLPDVSYGLFSLLCIYLYLKSSDDGGLSRGLTYGLSVFCYFIAMLFKEPAVLVPVILAGMDRAYGRAPGGAAGHAKRYGPYMAAAAAYLAMRLYALGSFAPNPHHTELTAYLSAINVFPLFTSYLTRLALPVNLNGYDFLHPVHSLLEPRALLAVLVAGLFAVAFFAAYRRSGAAFTGMLLVVVPVLPALYIPATGENSFAERYLYLPSAGAAVLAALFFRRALCSDTLRRPALAAFAAVLLLYSAGTVARNAVWKDDVTFWTDAVSKSGDKALTNYNLGRVLMRSKDTLPESIAYLKRAEALDPSVAKTHVNLGVAYFMMGRTDDAIDELDTAVELDTSFAEAHYNLGVAYMSKGMPGKAAASFAEALRLRPGDREYMEALDEAGRAVKAGSH